MSTAPMANQRGLPPWDRMLWSVTPVSLLNVSGRYRNAAPMTRISEMTADTKKPRLIAVMPLRSFLRGATTKMPITAVMTPSIGTISGKTRP